MAFQHSALLASVIGFVFLQATAGAADRLVPQQYPTIQEAITASSDGDVIIVGPSSSWAGFTATGKSLTIRSLQGFAVTKVAGGVSIAPGAGKQVELKEIMFLAGTTAASGTLRLTGTHHVNAALQLESAAAVIASSASFVASGASIVGASGPVCSFTNCRFTNCSTALSCGRPSISLSGCTFENCARAVDAPITNVVAATCRFRDCSVSGSTGVCRVGAGSFSDCVFTNCKISGGSTSAAGGAIHASGNLACIGCDFVGCSVFAQHLVTCGGEGCTAIAEVAGGAVFCGGDLQISGSVFADCFAKAEAAESICAQAYLKPRATGGAISAIAGQATVIDSEFIRSRSVMRVRGGAGCGEDFGDGFAFGGAMHLRTGVIDGCRIEDSQLVLENGGGIFQLAEIRRGAGIYGVAGGHLIIRDSEFRGNVGGSGYAIAGTSFELVRSAVIANGSAGGSSACLVLNGGSPLSEAFFRDSVFGSNFGIPASIGTAQAGCFAFLDGCTFCGPSNSECGGFWFEKSENHFSADCGSDCDLDGIPDLWAITQQLVPDCNLNGVPDSCDIASGGAADGDSNGIPDMCQQATCADADLYEDHLVNGADLGVLLAQWGPASPTTQSDLDRNGVVNGDDLGLLLSFWGPCP